MYSTMVAVFSKEIVTANVPNLKKCSEFEKNAPNLKKCSEFEKNVSNLKKCSEFEKNVSNLKKMFRIWKKCSEFEKNAESDVWVSRFFSALPKRPFLVCWCRKSISDNARQRFRSNFEPRIKSGLISIEFSVNFQRNFYLIMNFYYKFSILCLISIRFQFVFNSFCKGFSFLNNREDKRSFFRGDVSVETPHHGNFDASRLHPQHPTPFRVRTQPPCHRGHRPGPRRFHRAPHHRPSPRVHVSLPLRHLLRSGHGCRVTFSAFPSAARGRQPHGSVFWSLLQTHLISRHETLRHGMQTKSEERALMDCGGVPHRRLIDGAAGDAFRWSDRAVRLSGIHFFLFRLFIF